jgi:isopenicillin N synthase-like dioxygenase
VPTEALPIIDVSPLVNGGDTRDVARRIGEACRTAGFFYVSGHGVDTVLGRRLERSAADFFVRPLDEKLSIAMARGGRAWRGYFPVGAELTSGRPDRKEGLYFGTELPADHPLVLRKTPLHGPNLFPNEEMRDAVLGWMAAMERLGHALMRGVALSLGLEPGRFDAHGMADPLSLFRIFHYPAGEETEAWGVGEHTDYGVLTILKQDDCGGLQVKAGGSAQGGWIEAPPVSGTFVVNLGDMLERMTSGLYVSTPHRVRNVSGRSRYSFPFFFDPGFFAPVRPLEGLPPPPDDGARGRWDGASVHRFEGTYGDYLLGKVGKVFPQLQSDVL